MSARTLHHLTLAAAAGVILLATAIVVWSEEPATGSAVVAESSFRRVEPTLLHEHPTLVSMLAKSNELRARVGLKPHRMSPKLTKAAQNHADYMARTHTMSHHNNRGYQQRARDAGFNGWVMENIAMGYRSVPQVFGAWRASGGHWAAITSNTAEAGFGYQISANGTCYWCAVYGTEKK